jgi:hypothetical protein
MPYQRRTLARAGLGLALFVLGCGDDGSNLERNRGAAMVTDNDEDWRENYEPPPEYTEAICQHAWSVATVTGPVCTARMILRCDDAKLQSKLEALVLGCGISLSEEPVELSMSEGCVTGLAVSPSSPANDPAVFSCLITALGGVQAACSEQPDCIRLYGAAAPSVW